MESHTESIPRVWWDSFSTPSPLHGTGTQNSQTSSKNLLEKKKSLEKRLKGAIVTQLRTQRSLENALPPAKSNQKTVKVVDSTVPLRDAVFTDEQGREIKLRSQARSGRLAAEYAKCQDEVIRLKEELTDINKSMETE